MPRRVWLYAKLTVQASAAGLVADQHRDKRKRRIEKKDTADVALPFCLKQRHYCDEKWILMTAYTRAVSLSF